MFGGGGYGGWGGGGPVIQDSRSCRRVNQQVRSWALHLPGSLVSDLLCFGPLPSVQEEGDHRKYE